LKEDLHKSFQAYQNALYYLENIMDPQLWYGIGILYEKFESYEHAISSLMAVLKMSPNFYQKSEVLSRLGYIFARTNNLGDAIVYFQNSILTNTFTNKRKVEIMIKIGILHEEKNELTQAQKSYESSLSLDPENFTIFQHLSWVNFLQGNYQMAMDYANKSDAKSPGNLDTLYIKARINHNLGMHADAARMYDELIEKNQNSALYWCSYAVLNYEQNECEKAFEKIINATKLNGQMVESWFNFGVLYEKCKQSDEAVVAYRKALEIDPEDADSRQRLNSIQSQMYNPDTIMMVSMKFPQFRVPNNLVIDKKYKKPQNQRNLGSQLQGAASTMGLGGDPAMGMGGAPQTAPGMQPGGMDYSQFSQQQPGQYPPQQQNEEEKKMQGMPGGYQQTPGVGSNQYAQQNQSYDPNAMNKGAQPPQNQYNDPNRPPQNPYSQNQPPQNPPQQQNQQYNQHHNQSYDPNRPQQQYGQQPSGQQPQNMPPQNQSQDYNRQYEAQKYTKVDEYGQPQPSNQNQSQSQNQYGQNPGQNYNYQQPQNQGNDPNPPSLNQMSQALNVQNQAPPAQPSHSHNNQSYDNSQQHNQQPGQQNQPQQPGQQPGQQPSQQQQNQQPGQNQGYPNQQQNPPQNQQQQYQDYSQQQYGQQPQQQQYGQQPQQNYQGQTQPGQNNMQMPSLNTSQQQNPGQQPQGQNPQNQNMQQMQQPSQQPGQQPGQMQGQDQNTQQETQAQNQQMEMNRQNSAPGGQVEGAQPQAPQNVQRTDSAQNNNPMPPLNAPQMQANPAQQPQEQPKAENQNEGQATEQKAPEEPQKQEQSDNNGKFNDF
jgi:tetratricopeptide (TPR) repeat protein